MDGFAAFVEQRRADLKRVARHTRGECREEDVINEAWLLAATWEEAGRESLDLAAPDDRSLLISHLYQKLVRYTDVNVRHAVRLDHAPGGEEGSHPLLERLSVDGQDPLSVLQRCEQAPSLPGEGELKYSVASTYLLMLQHHNFRVSALARFLRLSVSHTYRCCADASLLSARQHALVLAPPIGMESLRPWRRYRALRIPRQLEFDFEDRLELCHSGSDPFSSGKGI
ncbi:TPA: hypothetical protein QEL15_000272 [Stenotrophomonas maltophilia]|nr:hypothetical protein [Stenotrophomonas maltophilia]